jgi:hypothetical protein
MVPPLFPPFPLLLGHDLKEAGPGRAVFVLRNFYLGDPFQVPRNPRHVPIAKSPLEGKRTLTTSVGDLHLAPNMAAAGLVEHQPNSLLQVNRTAFGPPGLRGPPISGPVGGQVAIIGHTRSFPRVCTGGVSLPALDKRLARVRHRRRCGRDGGGGGGRRGRRGGESRGRGSCGYGRRAGGHGRSWGGGWNRGLKDNGEENLELFFPQSRFSVGKTQPRRLEVELDLLPGVLGPDHLNLFPRSYYVGRRVAVGIVPNESGVPLGSRRQRDPPAIPVIPEH